METGQVEYPCWQEKGCQVRRCPAHGKAVDCSVTPNAGYMKKFCSGPMCTRTKRMVCPGCPVYKKNFPDSQAVVLTEKQILTELGRDDKV